MPKKVKEVIDILEKNGWQQIRMKGDHRIYHKEGARRPIVVSGNLNDDMLSGTLASILRESKLKK
jgi:predicted RNA binding protein YcfA (HicA-like mRNA interferase family)